MRYLLLIVGLLFLSGNSFAEPSSQTLFSIEQDSSSDIGTSEVSVKQRAIVQVKDEVFDIFQLPFYEQGGDYQDTLMLNLFGESVEARLLRIDDVGRDSIAWVGNIEGQKGASVTLVRNGAVVQGNIDFDGKHYQIRYLSGAIEAGSTNVLHVLEEVDLSQMPPEHPPGPLPIAPSSSLDDTNTTDTTNADDGSTIDVMVVYTPAARSASGGTTAIETLIGLAITESNDSFQNSGITHRYNLVHTEEVAYTEASSGAFSAALNAITSTTDGVMDNVHTLRDTYKADVVAILIDDSQYCGLAWATSSGSTVSGGAVSSDSAFSVTAYNCATGYYSFAHEIGHNSGTHHDWYVSSKPGYEHGYVNVVEQWRTIMGYNSECSAAGVSCTRIKYWSNPDVNYNGHPMGIADGASEPSDNRKQLNSSAYTVSNFRQGDTAPETPVQVSPSNGSTITETSPTYTWNAVSGAVEYQIYVTNSTTSNVEVNETFTSASTSCAAGNGVCSITPVVSLDPDTYKWFVRARNTAGSSAWSSANQFVVEGAPAKATLVSPVGMISDATPTYIWNAVSGATHYRLGVNDSTGAKIDVWYSASTAGCSSGNGTCSITTTTELAGGAGTWWIKTANSVGQGSWSAGNQFTVNPPGKAVLVSPDGSIGDTTPVYTWNAESGATHYRLAVHDSTGHKIGTWYTAAEASCSSGSGVCSVEPTTTLAAGSGKWWIKAANSVGQGAWSTGKVFMVSAPAKPTLISPVGAISDTTPTYLWNAVSGATFYRLGVNDSTGAKIDTWYSASTAGCGSGSGTCSITPVTSLAAGAGKWWVKAANSIGHGVWSAGSAFNVSAPGVATLISPSGLISDTTPTYQWNAVNGATFYRLGVNDSTGAKVDNWYSASTAGCSSGSGICSITPNTSLALGVGKWWIKAANSAGHGSWSSGSTFNVDDSGDFDTTISLTVTSTEAGSCTGEVLGVIDLSNASNNSLTVETSFESGDVDMSVEEPDGSCLYYGAQSSANGGSHTGDATSGGTEAYTISNGPVGVYTVRVHHHSSSSIATVNRIYGVGGAVVDGGNQDTSPSNKEFSFDEGK